jgi:hypothetical protein
MSYSVNILIDKISNYSFPLSLVNQERTNERTNGAIMTMVIQTRKRTQTRTRTRKLSKNSSRNSAVLLFAIILIIAVFSATNSASSKSSLFASAACGCSQPEPEPTDQCPIESEGLNVEVCLPYYQDQPRCEYDFICIGCSAETMRCFPRTSCRCNQASNYVWLCWFASEIICHAERALIVPESRSLLRNNLHNTGKEEVYQRRNLVIDSTHEQETPCVPYTPT